MAESRHGHQFLLGVLQSVGGSLVTTIGSAIWQHVKHGSVDWLAICGLFILTAAVFFLLFWFFGRGSKTETIPAGHNQPQPPEDPQAPRSPEELREQVTALAGDLCAFLMNNNQEINPPHVDDGYAGLGDIPDDPGIRDEFPAKFGVRIRQVQSYLGERTLLAERVDFSSVGDVLQSKVRNAGDVRSIIRALDRAKYAIDEKCIHGKPFELFDSKPPRLFVSDSPQLVFTPLQIEIIERARGLRQLLKNAGPPPEMQNKGPKPEGEDLQKWLAQRTLEALEWEQKRAEWTQQILYAYQRDFAQQVEQTIYTVGLEKIPIYDTNPTLDRNKIHNEADIEILIHKLMAIFEKIEEKR